MEEKKRNIPEQQEEPAVLFRKTYPENPDVLLYMEYYLKKDSTERIVKYLPDIHRKTSPEEVEQYDHYYGFYCLRCGEFHEFKTEDETETFYDMFDDMTICQCGIPFGFRHTCSANMSNRGRRGTAGMWRGIPEKVSITEKDSKIRIAATSKVYFIDPRKKTVYSSRFTITPIINTATGQTYYMSAVNRGEQVFTKELMLRNVSIVAKGVGYGEFDYVNKRFVEDDPDVRGALNKILNDRIPEIEVHACSLREMADINYFRDLYRLYPGMPEDDFYGYYFRYIWRMLRKRYCKNKATFPKYLYWGCSDVATKSIKKILYKYPERKWTLYFLRRCLGVTNIDVLRNTLKKEDVAIHRLSCNYLIKPKHPEEGLYEKIDGILFSVRTSGKTDQEKIDFIFSGLNAVMNLFDTARMLRDAGLPAEEILKYHDTKDCHDTLIAYRKEIRNRKIWEHLHKPIEYEEEINRIEEENDEFSFKIIRIPFELEEMQKRFHNCVNTYKTKIIERRSIILEMTLHGDPAVCIELSGSGRTCYQAYGPCNEWINGEKREIFMKWADKHHINYSKKELFGPF